MALESGSSCLRHLAVKRTAGCTSAVNGFSQSAVSGQANGATVPWFAGNHARGAHRASKSAEGLAGGGCGGGCFRPELCARIRGSIVNLSLPHGFTASQLVIRIRQLAKVQMRIVPRHARNTTRNSPHREDYRTGLASSGDTHLGCWPARMHLCHRSGISLRKNLEAGCVSFAGCS
jgi:hypothetical protein